MSLIQLRSGRRALLRLIGHLQNLFQRIDKAGSGHSAAPQSSGWNKLHFDPAIRQWRHNASSQLYLDNGIQGAVAGNAIKVDEGSAAVLGIRDPSLGIVGRGSLFIVI
jgi:hypothetical protein